MQNDNVKIKTDLKKRTFQFALRLIKLVDFLPKDMSSQIIGKQLIRSATSIGANVIEARAASSKRDFTNFFNHALKSANETVFWLELLRDSGKVRNASLDNIINEVSEIANILGASILTLKGKR